MLRSELDREAERSRRALELVPEGKQEWKPHDASMAFGYLVQMVATIPTWVEMIVKLDELDIKPKDGPRQQPGNLNTAAALIGALDSSLETARAALLETNDEHLLTPWRILATGEVQQERPRHVMIADMMNHWAHHRGQMTVYLRLMGAKVPALYGPSADDQRFG
jgi:uncharacterized damage-inducible protein DinB